MITENNYTIFIYNVNICMKIIDVYYFKNTFFLLLDLILVQYIKNLFKISRQHIFNNVVKYFGKKCY